VGLMAVALWSALSKASFRSWAELLLTQVCAQGLWVDLVLSWLWTPRWPLGKMCLGVFPGLPEQARDLPSEWVSWPCGDALS